MRICIRENGQNQHGACVSQPESEKPFCKAAASGERTPQKSIDNSTEVDVLTNFGDNAGTKAEDMSGRNGETVPRGVSAVLIHHGDFGTPQHGQSPAGHKIIPAAWSAFKESVRLLATVRSLLLSVTSLYTGLVLSFYSGVFSTSVGFTLTFKNSKSLMGLMGIFVGLGAVTSGLLFGVLGKITRRKGETLDLVSLQLR